MSQKAGLHRAAESLHGSLRSRDYKGIRDGLAALLRALRAESVDVDERDIKLLEAIDSDLDDFNPSIDGHAERGLAYLDLTRDELDAALTRVRVLMLSLTSPRWSALQHAYGSAADVPALLRALERFPRTDDGAGEPYDSLWGALCHQGDVYTASYAALPHLLAAVALDPARAPWTILLLAAQIEIAREGGAGPEMPEDLEEPYFAALRDAPRIVALTAAKLWDHNHVVAATALIAAAMGHPQFADTISNMSEEDLDRLADDEDE